MPISRDLKAAVVIVNYNSGLYLERCLRSVLRSDISLEICVVDNHSSDDSLDKLSALETNDHQLQVIRNSKNLGFSSGVNVGARETNAPYLIVLNPDCYVHSHTMRAFIEALCAQGDAGMAGALVFNEDGTEQRGCRRKEPTLCRSAVKALGLSKWFDGVDLHNKPLPESSCKVDAVSGSAMIFHRRCFVEVDGMDEGYFLHCEDLDICRRVREKGYGVYFVPSVSLFHRQGVSGRASNSQVEALKHEGMMRYYTKHYGRQNPLSNSLIYLLVWMHFAVKQCVGWMKGYLRSAPDASREISESRNSSTLLANLPGPDSSSMLLVTGANSDVGDYLLEHVSNNEEKCVAAFRSRSGHLFNENIFWLSDEYFNKAPVADLPKFDRWIHLAPIWTVDRFQNLFGAGWPQRAVALSSTSIDAKAASDDAYESAVVNQLEQGELTFQKLASDHQFSWVVLRPTMIYGGRRNRNVNLIQNVIRWIRSFPLVGEGEGKRQPVHAEDIALACDSAMRSGLNQQIYSVAGAEVISFRNMVERVFQSLGQPVRIFTVSPGLAKKILGLVKGLPGFRGLSPGIIDRLQNDQTFSNSAAVDDFEFTPRKFEP